MKKIIILSIITMCGLCVFSQESTKTKINIIDTDCAKLDLGKSIINLPYKINPEEYFVMITPMGSNAELFLETKTFNHFIIRSETETDIEFQYTILHKKTKRLLIPEHKVKNKITPNN